MWYKSKIGIVSTVDSFFGAATFGLTELNFLLKLCSLSLLVQKPIYSLKWRFLWCGKFMWFQ
ncbi:hypothetical protein M634_10895 [Vibrio parahaemolyticus O1:Kuk str. FDA_R31]|nr:hypothetical protein M634_10895 [Vibrio parahaemolyticus O1:Kuk str. FDA_R31]